MNAPTLFLESIASHIGTLYIILYARLAEKCVKCPQNSQNYYDYYDRAAD